MHCCFVHHYTHSVFYRISQKMIVVKNRLIAFSQFLHRASAHVPTQPLSVPAPSMLKHIWKTDAVDGPTSNDQMQRSNNNGNKGKHGKAAFSLLNIKKVTYEQERKIMTLHYFGENGASESICNVDENVYDMVLDEVARLGDCAGCCGKLCESGCFYASSPPLLGHSDEPNKNKNGREGRITGIRDQGEDDNVGLSY
jgi:hypothetical protein